jgi:8-oxo-dGTP pyrophosphatase MutT (NUDIX family)
MSPYCQKLRRVYGKALLIMPSVAAVNRDRTARLLLIEKHDGTWSLPAGVIDRGETPEQAAAREVKEETGMICVGYRLLGLLGGCDCRCTYAMRGLWSYLMEVNHSRIMVDSFILLEWQGSLPKT